MLSSFTASLNPSVLESPINTSLYPDDLACLKFPDLPDSVYLSQLPALVLE